MSQPKKISDLINRFQALGKEAAHPESTTDPAESGTKTDVSGEDTKDDLLGTQEKAVLKNPPEQGSPAADTKSPAGSAESEVPGGKPFVENGKCASKDKIIALKNRFAEEFGKEAKSSTDAKSAGEEGKSEQPKQAADEGVVTPHLIEVVLELQKSASGREILLDGLAEGMGLESARELMSKAASEYEVWEQETLNKQAKALMDREYAQALEEDNARRSAQYQELTKEASDEQRQVVDNSYVVLASAHEKVAAHPAADQAFRYGSSVAEAFAAQLAVVQKEAMAMPEGQAAPSEDEAMMAAMQGGMGGAPEGEPSIEEIIAALEELVQSGEMSPEEAEQLLMELQAEGGLEGGEADMEGGMPPEAMKAASALVEEVSQLVDELA